MVYMITSTYGIYTPGCITNHMDQNYLKSSGNFNRPCEIICGSKENSICINYALLKTSAVENAEPPDNFSRKVSKMLQRAKLSLPYLIFAMLI
jgi:hypothetical protein